MLRLPRKVVAPALLLAASACLTSVGPNLMAQPPFGGGKVKDFDKSKVKDFEKFKEKAPSVDAVKKLEADLEKLKALEADIQAQLKKLKQESTPEPKRAAPKEEFGRGRESGRFSGFGPGGFGGFGPGGFGGFGRGRPMGGDMPREGGMAHGVAHAFSFMSTDQLKEFIVELEKLRAEKLRAAAPEPRRAEQQGRSGGRPGPGADRPVAPAPANAEILNRLDRLSRELEEIRNSLASPRKKN